MSDRSVSPATLRVLTELDHVRIGRCLAAGAHPAVQRLLDDADVVPSDAVDPDVVTMRSRVRVCDPDQADGGLRELTLVYPDEADAARGQVSVLSPVGAALLGLRAGALARWTQPDGRAAALRVQAVTFQPEACGELLR
ncbi:GreA/GreB family elongation factor [Pseudorhodoferax sp.]|uniref:GreA/GreB family elongation factor n=1 Tax=Pseudorhodoferax sp. TaxID=1993553 RepID=UPI0039E48E0F